MYFVTVWSYTPKLCGMLVDWCREAIESRRSMLLYMYSHSTLLWDTLIMIVMLLDGWWNEVLIFFFVSSFLRFCPKVTCLDEIGSLFTRQLVAHLGLDGVVTNTPPKTYSLQPCTNMYLILRMSTTTYYHHRYNPSYIKPFYPYRSVTVSSQPTFECITRMSGKTIFC